MLPVELFKMSKRPADLDKVCWGNFHAQEERVLRKADKNINYNPVSHI